MKLARLAVAVLALVAITGCGGSSHSCSDICTAAFDCAAKLNFSPSAIDPAYTSVSSCISLCNASTCPNQQKANDCIAGLSCSTENGYVAGIYACLSNAGC